MYDIDALRQKLGEQGVLLHYEKTLPSTNLYLKEKKPRVPTVCLCDQQTAGYGQGGKAWLPGGVTVSYVREVTGERPYSLYCGLAAVRALNKTVSSPQNAASIRLKWPNDLVVAGKKLAGILCEGYFLQEKRYMIFGIGINTEGDGESFSRAGLPHAVSLAMTGRSLPSPEDFICGLTEQLDAMVTADEKTRDALLEEYRSVSATIGKEVRLSSPEGEWQDRATGVDGAGRLVLESGKTVLSGEVSVRGLYDYIE